MNFFIFSYSSLKMNLIFSTLMLILFMDTVIYGKETCPQLSTTEKINVQEMMGTWYAVRGIEHTSLNSNSNTKRTKSCPIITLKLKNTTIEFRWQSKDKPERKLRLKINAESPNLWEHKSTKQGNSNAPFRSLQVTTLPETKNVWGATMCKAGGRIASVVLSREPKFSENQVSSVTNLLEAQGLPVNNIFDRCTD